MPSRSAVRLHKDLADWLKVNGELIYATRNPLDEHPEWGDVSVGKDDKNVYLHILECAEIRTLVVKAVSSVAVFVS
jgi:hypothetical protein